MKKAVMFLFCCSLLICAGLLTNFVLKQDLQADTPSQNQIDTEEEPTENYDLILSLPESVELVVGQTYLLNYSPLSAVVSAVVSNTEIIEFSNSKFTAKSSGETFVTVNANYNNEHIQKSVSFVVLEKEIIISYYDQSFNQVTNFFSGKKADDTYQNYLMQVDANFNLRDVCLFDESMVILNGTLSDNEQTATFLFNLTEGESFEFEIGCCNFELSATEFLSEIEVEVLSQNLTFDNSYQLYYLQNQNLIAYQEFKFDYFEFVLPDNVLVELENQTYFEIENVFENTFRVTSKNVAGQANLVFTAQDGSLLTKQISLKNNLVYGENATVNLQEELSLFENESFLIEVSNFLPVYATVNQIEILNLNPSVVSIEDNSIYALMEGEATIQILLNNNLILQSVVTVASVELPPIPQEEVYEILFFDSGSYHPKYVCDFENNLINVTYTGTSVNVYFRYGIYVEGEEQESLLIEDYEITSGLLTDITFDGKVIGLIGVNQNLQIRFFNYSLNAEVILNVIIN